jgi:hypothetical protein
MDLKIEGPDLQKLLESAVVQALGEAGREALVKECVKYLTTPQGSYRDQKSPLLQALHAAAGEATKRYVTAKMANDPELISMIDSLYVDAFKRFNDAEVRSKLIDRMADRLESAFSEKY